MTGGDGSVGQGARREMKTFRVQVAVVVPGDVSRKWAQSLLPRKRRRTDESFSFDYKLFKDYPTSRFFKVKSKVNLSVSYSSPNNL